MLRLFHFSTDCPEILKLKKSNVILVKLSYIDLVLKFHDNRLKNGNALALSDVKNDILTKSKMAVASVVKRGPKN